MSNRATVTPVEPNPADDFVAPPCKEAIEILYQDASILLINKPSGLLSLSGKNPLNKDSVHYRLVQTHPSAKLLHRLDLGTSGIMLVALTKEANSALTRQFQARTIAKQYTAVLLGHTEQDRLTIQAPIARGLFPRQIICEESGKSASSHLEVIEKMDNPARSRVIFSPLTGRTHQLRIHSQWLGHPILGCDLYGTQASETLAPRLLLHANKLSFEHPDTGQEITIECACPF